MFPNKLIRKKFVFKGATMEYWNYNFSFCLTFAVKADQARVATTKSYRIFAKDYASFVLTISTLDKNR